MLGKEPAGDAADVDPSTGVPRQLNSQGFPQSQSDDPTGDSPCLAFVPSLPHLEDQGSGGDMVAYRDESSGANDASTLLNIMTTEPGNLALSWTLAIACILTLGFLGKEPLG